MLSPLRKVSIFIKRIVLDEIFIFRDSLMSEYQRIEKNENIFDFQTFRSGLNAQNKVFAAVNQELVLLSLNYS